MAASPITPIIPIALITPTPITPTPALPCVRPALRLCVLCERTIMTGAVISRGLHGWPRQDLAQRRKGAKTVLAGELNLCGLLAVGLLTFVFSTWRRGEETRNNHQAGFAALRSLRENNHDWRCNLARATWLASSRSRAEAQRRKDLASLLLGLRKTIGIIGIRVIGAI